MKSLEEQVWYDPKDNRFHVWMLNYDLTASETKDAKREITALLKSYGYVYVGVL